MSVSTKTSEFIIHLHEQKDLRFSSYNQRDQIILFILKKLCVLNKELGRFPIYFEESLNLESFCRYQNKGRLPSLNSRVFMNAEEFFIKTKNEQSEKIE